jgi:1-acyl-sn-glycerol-3-phosphate acyltransferase
MVSGVEPRVRFADFSLVRQLGPSVAERVDGSDQLRSRQRLGRRICRGLTRARLIGLDRIPERGPLILAVNHRSAIDGVLLFGYVERVVTCIVKAEAFGAGGGRVGRLLIDAAQIPVRRGEIDPAPIRLSLDVLNAGGVLGIFLEGSRGDGRVQFAKPGVGYFALKTGATVVPVAIHGATAATHRTSIRRPLVTMIVGQPLSFAKASTDRTLARRDWVEATEQIRGVVAGLVRDSADHITMRASKAASVAKAQ